MGKNDTLADAASSMSSSTADAYFKELIRYKAIAALLIKGTITEFKDKSLADIARCIVDTTSRNENTDLEVLEGEIDLKQQSIGTKDEKNTIHDAVFDMRINDVDCVVKLGNMLTVNTEMQTTTSKSSLHYSLLSRAIYYAASLLRGTVPAGDTEYSNLHKVYSIWFCSEHVKLDNPVEVSKDEYIHRIRLCRSYKSLHNQVVTNDKEMDLMEVILVDLKTLEKNITNEFEQAMYDVFFNTPNVVNEINNIAKINLTKVRKGVDNMLDAKKLAENERAEGIEEGTTSTQLHTVEAFLKSLKKKGKDIESNPEKIISYVSETLDIPKDIVQQAYEAKINSEA